MRICMIVCFLMAHMAGLPQPQADTGGATDPVVELVLPDTNEWGFVFDSGTNGSGEFVDGPGTPPYGIGSVEIAVNNSATGLSFVHPITQTVYFSDVTALAYSTYRAQPAQGALAIAMSFNIDHDLSDGNTAWQGRLTYEPYRTQTVSTTTWQTWNTLESMNTGNWWRSTPTVAPTDQCIQANPCTWDEVLSHWPQMGIHQTYSLVVFKAGSGWSAFRGNIDGWVFGVNGVTTIYDFETRPYAAISVEPSTASQLTVSEDGTDDQFTVVLESPPTAPVTITAVVSDSQSVLSSAALSSTSVVELVFTELNWSVPQTVTVMAIDDQIAETSPHTSVVELSITDTSAPEYVDLTFLRQLEVLITDNDDPGITTIITTDALLVDETGPTSATYGFVLQSEPGAPVTITASVADAQVVLSTDGISFAASVELVFTPDNWNQPRTIYVQAVDDAAIEAPLHTSTIAHTVASPDDLYAPLQIADTEVQIIDNDAAPTWMIFLPVVRSSSS